MENKFLLALFASLATLPLAAQPLVAHDEEGNRIVIWTSSQSGAITIQSTTFLQGAGWLPTITLSSPLRYVVSNPILAINKLNQAVVVWESYDPLLEIHCVESTRTVVGQAWSEPFILSSKEEDATQADSHLSLDDNGHTCVIWTSSFTGSPNQVHIRSSMSDFSNGWSEPVTLSCSELR